MENYELYIPPVLINPVNGRFRKGHIPFNKGIPMREWMDGRKIRRVKKNLESVRMKGNLMMPGSNRKKVIAIKGEKLIAYPSAVDAAKILRQKGIRINARNINSVCHKKRKKAGNYEWFFENDLNNKL